MRPHQPGDDPAVAAQLFLGQPGHRDVGELARAQVGQPLGDAAPKLVAEALVGERVLDDGSRAAGTREGLGEQVAQDEHLDAVPAQRLGELVVLLLSPLDPGNAVEEQVGGVARRQPGQLGAGPVQHDRTQPADLAVGAVRTLVGSVTSAA